jgi:hypothetical protein
MPMIKSISPYIEERIRRAPPPDASVVNGSTPVVSFGNAQDARVATLGLNPSRIEFLDRTGRLLDGRERRLATHTSLGVSDLASAPIEAILQVLEDCNTYFQRKPYCGWFNQLMPILKACDASYYDGSACHLDLVQWATDPTWGKLRPATIRNQLIADDSRFLAYQLQNENIRVLLVNGHGVWRQLHRWAAGHLASEHSEDIVGLAHQPTRLYSATLFGRVRVLAWSTNLQSSFGVTAQLRAELPKRVAALLAL